MAAINIRTLRLTILATLSIPLLAACQRADAPAPAEAAPAPDAEHAQAGVELTTEEMQKIGVTAEPAAAATFRPEAAGYGIVLGHDVIAQTVADVVTAQAAARQSQAALARVKGLAETPGAFSAETLENAERQASADAAALTLARRKLSATWGARSPWSEDEASAVLRDVAGGKVKLARATFPLGALPGPEPKALRFSRLGQQDAAATWTTDAVWDAPADSTIPGRSLFALLKHGDASEGERLDVRAAVGAALSGVLVPQSAIVISDDRYWCYVEQRPGSFVRKAVDPNRPTDGGYFVERDVAVGEPIVVAGAGLLLARETNPSTEAD